jgi:GT2 family glycosyltransferase/glycosyltransferase involved in cell wall biosynthesis
MPESLAFNQQSPDQPHSQERQRFFETLAEWVAHDSHLHSILAVGRTASFLVEDLRQRGVSAFGLDVSAEAVQKVSGAIQPFCRVGSITEPLPQTYDLIIFVGDLADLSPQELAQTVENFCQHSDDVIFTIEPNQQDAKQPNVQPPVYWAELFARHGFFRDLDFKVSFAVPGIARFQKKRASIAGVIAAYERRFWQLEQENQTYRHLNLEQQEALAAKEQTILAWQTRWTRLEGSMGWVLAQKLQHWRSRLAPAHSLRDQLLEGLFRAWQTRQWDLLADVVSDIGRIISWQARGLIWKTWLRLNPPRQGRLIEIDEIVCYPPVQAHQVTVDIIICVHNAFTEVQPCLQAVERHSSRPYSLILVDDGSDSQTRDYLAKFVESREAILLRNETPRGYTKAVNQGLRHSRADYVVFLNSDTVVTAGWLDRLVACASSNPRIGLVGPLSNTASWQSIPKVDSGGDWAGNPLPPDVTVEDMGRLVDQYSAPLYPTMPFLNGFCLMIRRQVIDQIGFFDEENFGAGYGEENDYALRARKAGWLLALADNAYVYHAQSRSYSNERRRHLSERASIMLAKLHGSRIIAEGVSVCRHGRVLEGIRARSQVMIARQEWLRQGRAEFAGRRLLFILPVLRPGGGANVIVDEATAMREMGVDAQIFNLAGHQAGFEQSYRGLTVPVLYGAKEDLVNQAGRFDAVVATANFTVEWLAPVAGRTDCPILGYYVQEFEPYMYSSETVDYQRAWASYALLPDLVRFTKTEWTRQEVKSHIGVDCRPIGISLNIDLLRPRPRSGPDWPERPLRVVAMVRPRPLYRNPKLTMTLLRQLSRQYTADVEIVIFGVPLENPDFAELPRDFAWRLAGVLTQKQVASLLNEADIFVDFSSHQSMGLTVLEAMACGAAVIAPQRGGAVTFARHEENSLVVDTSSPEACWQALQRLVEDDELRARLQRKALFDVCDFFPERPAFNILRVLFDSGPPDSS